MRKALVASVSIHSLIGFILFLDQPCQVKNTPEPVSFEIIEGSSSTQVATSLTKAPRVKAGSAKLSKGDFFARNYGANAKPSAEASLSVPEVQDIQNKPLNDLEVFAADSSAVLADHDRWSFYQAIYERIDQHIVFDSLLAQYDHFGTVVVQFEVSPQGRLLDQNIKVWAEDAILKVHVMRALRKALATELVKNKWLNIESKLLARAKFDFVSAGSSINRDKQKAFGKPTFNFVRATTEKPVASNLRDHLTSGGIGLDPFAMAEKWKKYSQAENRRAGDVDPFSHYRRDPDYYL